MTQVELMVLKPQPGRSGLAAVLRARPGQPFELISAMHFPLITGPLNNYPDVNPGGNPASLDEPGQLRP